MQINIFNNTKTVNIADNLVNSYEENVAPFHAKRAEYFAVSGGLDENSNEKELKKGIEEGIWEEIKVYRHRDEIIGKAIKQGLIR